MKSTRIIKKGISTLAIASTTLYLTASAASAAVLPTPSPTFNGLGNVGTSVQTIVNWVEMGCLVVCLLAFFISAASWAYGTHSRSSTYASGGKFGMITSILAAILIGFGSLFINTAFGL